MQPSPNQSLRDRITPYRLKQPIAELERKARKARRRSIFTQEDIDAANVRAGELYKWFAGLEL